MKQASDGLRVIPGKFIAKHGCTMQLIRTGPVQIEQPVAQIRAEWQIKRLQQRGRGRTEISQHRIDSIKTGARHQADIVSGFQLFRRCAHRSWWLVWLISRLNKSTELI